MQTQVPEPTLYKRSNGRYYAQWHCADRSPSQKQKSLRTSRKREALRKLDKLADEGFNPWKPNGGNGRSDLKRLGGALSAFLKSRENLSDHTWERYRSVCTRLTDFLGEGTVTASIESRDVMRWMRSTDTKPVTRHSYQRALKTWFNWLREQGEIDSNPAEDLRLERAPDKHPRFLSRAQVDALCKAIRGRHKAKHVQEGTSLWLLPIVQANVYLGLRANEVCRLRWEDVDFEAGTVTVRQREGERTKSGKDRTLPMCDAVRDVFEGLERRSEYVFPNHGGTKLHRLYLSRRFKHFARLAELPEEICFHSTRHTAASWLAQAGTPVEAIRRYMGHSSTSVTEKYMHLSPDDLARAIDAAFS